MTLTLNQSTSIRPLGEEHLRMFKRMAVDAEATPKIHLPKEAGRVRLGDILVRSEDAEKVAASLGGRLATLMAVVMDKRLLNQVRRTHPVFIDWRDVPNEIGWYRVNRKKGTLTRIKTERKIDSLDWPERLCIWESAIGAIKEKRPLIFDVSYATDTGEVWLNVSDKGLSAGVAFIRGD